MFRSVRAAGAVALAAALLSGCSLLPSLPQGGGQTPAAETGQTVAEACAAILPVILDTNSRMSDAFSELQADPKAAGPLLHAVSEDLHAVTDTLENPEVLEAMTTATDSLDAMIVEVDAAIGGDPDQVALLQTATKAREDFAALDPICQGA